MASSYGTSIRLPHALTSSPLGVRIRSALQEGKSQQQIGRAFKVTLRWPHHLS